MSQGASPDAAVRDARPDDADDVGAVQAAVFADTYGTALPETVVSRLTPQAFADGWRASLANPPGGAHRLLVATEAARVVGIAAVGPSQDPDADSDAAELTLLAVLPGRRGIGHGSRLLNAAVEGLRDLGAGTLATWIPADAEATRAFLVGAGLRPDAAYRDRVVSPEGDTLREVRMRTTLVDGGE